MDLGDPDFMWQDYADDFIAYAAACILSWGDSRPEAPKELMTYDAWLVRTERREPCGQNVGREETSPRTG
jgi:hypothetical protein